MAQKHITEKERDRLCKWSALDLMNWYKKGNRPTCYYYGDDGYRTTTIRNWRPDQSWEGQIWMIIDKMKELGFFIKIENDCEKWLVRFYKEGEYRWEIHSDPCIAILLAAELAFKELYEKAA